MTKISKRKVIILNSWRWPMHKAIYLHGAWPQVLVSMINLSHSSSLPANVDTCLKRHLFRQQVINVLDLAHNRWFLQRATLQIVLFHQRKNSGLTVCYNHLLVPWSSKWHVCIWWTCWGGQEVSVRELNLNKIKRKLQGVPEIQTDFTDSSLTTTGGKIQS